MKTFAIILIGTLLAVGLVVGAEAQTVGQPGSGTANPEAKPDNPTDRRNDPAPQPATPQRDSSPRGDDGAALPRQTSPETPGIFGLSSTFVALLAAALFIVAVLAVVAMTRGGSERRADLNRRS